MKSKFLATLRVGVATLFVLLTSGLASTAPVYAATCPAGTGITEQGNKCKITICHADSAASKPYTSPTVDFDAADGSAGNDNGQGDHYLNHNAPVFDAVTMHQGDNWGDIIPPIPGIHGGLNWTAAGQAIYFNGCAPVTQATPTAVSFNDVCGVLSDSYTIPSKTGVDYKVGGVIKAAGTYAGTGTVTVTAEAQVGYVLTGATSWTQVFNATPCLINATAAVGSFTDTCGVANDSYTIPTTVGVVYKVNGNVKVAGTYPGSGAVTIEAFALPTHTLSGVTSWSHTFDAVPCPISVTPGTVAFNETCGTANDTFTIPSMAGVTYKINSSTVAAGTQPGSGTVTVTAEAQTGYVLTGTTTWAHTFTNEDCPVPPTDLCKNIDGIQTTVPFGMTVDNAGNCTTPGIPQVLGDSTTATTPTPPADPQTPAVNAAELVNTGSSILLNLFVGLFVIGLATIITIASRKNGTHIVKNNTTSSISA